MKILHLLYEFKSGGAERFVCDLANWQFEAGNQVSVCILRPITTENSFCSRFLHPGIDFYSLDISVGITPAKIMAVARAVKSVSPDILHCHHNIVPYIAGLMIGKNDIHIIHTIHSASERANKNSMERALCRCLYLRKKITPVTISNVNLKSFERVYGLSTACIPNGRAALEASSAFLDVRDYVNTLKRDEKTRVFIHVARCHPVKNQIMLVQAFNELLKKFDNCILLVLGSGFDGPEGEAIRKAAAPVVHFLGEKENVQDYLILSDYFCLSSFSEGLSISLLEALACGVTPVCTPVGGNVDVISDAKNGYLSKDVSTESYAEALCRSAKAPLDRSFLQQYFESHFSIDACASAYQSLYENIAHND